MTLLAPRPQPHLPPQPHQTRTTPDLFGTLIMEITTPSSQPTTPNLPGWELRTWPVARLGDATLEAHPVYPHLSSADLHQALKAAGYNVLGPIRQRR